MTTSVPLPAKKNFNVVAKLRETRLSSSNGGPSSSGHFAVGLWPVAGEAAGGSAAAATLRGRYAALAVPGSRHAAVCEPGLLLQPLQRRRRSAAYFRSYYTAFAGRGAYSRLSAYSSTATFTAWAASAMQG